MKHVKPYPAKLFSDPRGGPRMFSWLQFHLSLLFLDAHVICQPFFFPPDIYLACLFNLYHLLNFQSQNRDTQCSQSANFS